VVGQKTIGLFSYVKKIGSSIDQPSNASSVRKTANPKKKTLFRANIFSRLREVVLKAVGSLGMFPLSV
jgi:hypothetical protein